MTSNEARGMRIGVLASGRGSNLGALLDAQAAGRLGGAQVTLVLSDQPDAPALERARGHGVASTYVDPGSSRARLGADAQSRYVQRLLDSRVNWVLLAGFLRIVGSPILGAFPDRVLNIHPSLLPAFPGLRAQRQAIEHGVRVSGCTVHLVDEGVDTGPILEQRVVPVRPGDSEDSLSARILAQEHEVLVETVRRIAEHGFVRMGRLVRWKGEA